MSLKLKKLALMLTTMIILLNVSLPRVEIVFSENSNGKIDLFTQKEPYSGKGPNTSSDAFGPQELVILYALVTYNEVPVQNLLVTFHVQTPGNASFSLSEKTNSSGVANINFTIPWPCTNVSEVFGEWHASANTVIGYERPQDSLTFKVGWVVELISVRTIDENLTYRTIFGIEGDVGLEITLKNIAMVTKTVMIAIVIQDELDVPVSFYEIHNFNVQPNEKLVILYCKLHIPKWAHVGKGTVFVSALTAPPSANGVAYCPAISTNFYIMPFEPLTISFHDVSVIEVIPSTNSVEVGQIVNIYAVIQNEGTENESFSVNAYYDDALIETFSITLASHSHEVLNFTFNTKGVAPANYTISVSVPFLVNEADLTDNVLVDGIVEVKPKLPAVIHNIAIVDVKLSANIVYIGDSLQINVSIANKGTETENFSVGVYYDFTLIETLQVSAFAPGTHQTLSFVWNTTSVNQGLYQISAIASLPEDIDVSDNTFLDGFVQVKAKPHLLHDIAVLSVSPSLTSLISGEVNEIYVIVKNQGNFTESFNVTIYYDENIIDTLLVEELAANTQIMLHFNWNTQNVAEGNYTLSALASAVSGEENLENNLFVDGIVEVKALIRDIAVIEIVPSSSRIYIGEILSVNVTLKNKGSETESFNLTLYYDSKIVDTLFVEGLAPNTSHTVTFHWDTHGVAEDNYTLSAFATPIPGEEYTEDNYLENGIVEVIRSPVGWFVPDWFWWLLLLLILIILLLLLWLYFRRKRKRGKEAFHSGWTAWYYCYDLRKIRKM